MTTTPDPRLAAPRHTDTEFAPVSFASREEWEEFRAHLQTTLRVACGMYHAREWAPLEVNIRDTIVHDDYTVEKASFEALPGFLVTGNLYRPRGEGAFPIVACPHGHWDNGRLEDSERGSVPARCITFARMGIVSFAYDMVGYVDSTQFPFDWGHFSDMPMEERRKEHLWGIHPFSVQLWSSLRVVDFLQGLPGVDPARVGCVGASGGGTQTFVLSALDDRVIVSAPVTMISHTMQGGCTCENAPLIRIHASNVEIGAMAAPRPMILVSATGDWTRATPEVEYPAIKAVYGLYGAADTVSNTHIEAPHNFNQPSREAVYQFLAKHLLGQDVDGMLFDEPPYTVDPDEAVRVFPDGAPESFPTGDALIAQWMTAHAERAHNALRQYAGDDDWHTRLREAWGIAMGIGPRFNENRLEDMKTTTLDDGTEVRSLTFVRDRWDGQPAGAVPIKTWRPATLTHRIRLVVLAHPEGPAALAEADGITPGRLVNTLLAAGCVVAAPAVFDPAGRARPRFDDTFAPSDTAWRVQDIADAAHYAYEEWSGDQEGPPTLILAGVGEAGMWTWLAAPLLRRVHGVVVDADGFDPGDNDAWAERLYVPSIRSLGGLEAATHLLAPAQLTVFGLAGDRPDYSTRHQAVQARIPRYESVAATAAVLRNTIMAV